MKAIPRKHVPALLRLLDAKAKAHPDVRMGSSIWRNGRGDYGRTEEYFLRGKPALSISIDGARRDVRFYADIEVVNSIGAEP